MPSFRWSLACHTAQHVNFSHTVPFCNVFTHARQRICNTLHWTAGTDKRFHACSAQIWCADDAAAKLCVFTQNKSFSCTSSGEQSVPLWLFGVACCLYYFKVSVFEWNTVMAIAYCFWNVYHCMLAADYFLTVVCIEFILWI